MSTDAIRKLRKNFITIAMLSFIAVMVFTGGLINLASNLRIRSTMGSLLDYIINNGGDLPEHEEAIEASTAQNAARRARQSAPAAYDVLGFNSEYRYTTRYYAVLFDADGEVEDVKLSHIHSVKYTEAIEAAQLIRNYSHGFGSFGNSYFFKTAEYDDGSTIVAVIDATIQVDISKNAIHSTVLICGIGLLITFLAVLAASGRMIRPEIENARRQKMFITNASHELKTPLAVIRANTELEELMNGETEWTQSTLRQIDRLNGLIQNLVMIARAQEAENPDLARDIDASAAILETIRPYASLAMQEGKTLSTEGIAPGLRMTADESKIRQLAAILIDNAFKYCDEKGCVAVTFSKTRISRQLRLAISNSYAAGRNVDYARFFERFYREDASHNADGTHDAGLGKGGYGIGLSIAESICTQYKGSIRASWKDGAITFTCLLGT